MLADELMQSRLEDAKITFFLGTIFIPYFCEHTDSNSEFTIVLFFSGNTRTLGERCSGQNAARTTG